MRTPPRSAPCGSLGGGVLLGWMVALSNPCEYSKSERSVRSASELPGGHQLGDRSGCCLGGSGSQPGSHWVFGEFFSGRFAKLAH